MYFTCSLFRILRTYVNFWINTFNILGKGELILRRSELGIIVRCQLECFLILSNRGILFAVFEQFNAKIQNDIRFYRNLHIKSVKSQKDIKKRNAHF